ncbi:MAG: glycosyltransferase [Lachnospiraceae bacterium]|nr:glycosyltransferase [Lachnospiraceae bacterium]
MPEILVTILTPCYNSGKTIDKTLECIEKQTYKNIEYIIVDGGSTDDTLAVIERHRDRLPKAFTLISEKDNGIYDAMNKGIKLARGQLIGIVNSDDSYEYDTVEQVVNHYCQNQYEVVYGMQRTYLEGREKAVVIYHHDFLPQQMITHPTCFVTRDTYEKFGVFDTQYRSAADYDLMLRYYKSGNVVFTPVYHVLSNFCLGGMSSSQTGVRENALVRFRYGYLSGKRYRFLILKSYLYEFLHKKRQAGKGAE